MLLLRGKTIPWLEPPLLTPALRANGCGPLVSVPGARRRSLNTSPSCIIVPNVRVGPAWPTNPPRPSPSSALVPHEGPLIRVICVSHHLVSLRTHWSLVDSSLRPGLLFSFLMWTFYLAFFSEAEVTSSRPGDRMLFLTGFPVRGLRSGQAEMDEA